MRVRNLSCVGVGIGSAVAIGRQTLVTNAHVVQGAIEIQVNTWTGRTFDTRVAAAAFLDDLAVVRTVAALPAVARLGTDPAPGDTVRIAGFPYGGRLRLVEGRVTDDQPGDRYGQRGRVMRIDATIAPGNSGGPVFNAAGELVGVAFGADRVTGHALAIPVSSLRSIESRADLRAVPGDCSDLED